ncbi:MAG: hypothetical protein Q9227_007260 [Pyrenula ochraceoflavens]
MSSVQIGLLNLAPSSVSVPAGIAWACLETVPLKQQDALSLADGLLAFLGFQSTVTYLKSPPSGYLLPGVDLLGGLQKIRQSVASGRYTSELAFQTDINNLLYAAHDGHLSYSLDLLSVFSFQRTLIGPLVSIAQSYSSGLPQIYRVSEFSRGFNSSGSPISQIDGVPASQWIQAWSLNNNFQDPDTLYNQVFYEVAKDNPYGGFLSNGFYTGDTTVLTYQNGSSKSFQNFATINNDFTDVDSGDAFYSKFCSGTTTATSMPTNVPSGPPQESTTTSTDGPTATSTEGSTSTQDPRSSFYPTPIVESVQGFAAGYFLDGAYSDTAVLSVISFNADETDNVDFQSTISQFLQAAINSGKTKLIVDMSQNDGGTIMLAYDMFKQLFPMIEPFGAHSMRATPELNVLGQLLNPEIAKDRANGSSDETIIHDGGYGPFDATWIADVNENPWPSWAAMFGPQQIAGDKYTNLARFQPARADLAGFQVSGYGNRKNIPPQPFKSDNIVLFYDGSCSSSCYTFTQLMKFQGKVKSVVVGGRPQPGPMAAVGGVKGSQVYHFAPIYTIANQVVNNGARYGIPAATIASINSTNIGKIALLGEYVGSRTPSPGDNSFNLRNTILPGDDSWVPAQFIYEAADCRIWWTREMLRSMTNIWSIVAKVTWQDRFSSCVAGSTGQPSSLSGNATLDNAGKPNNVTGSAVPTGSGGGASSSPTPFQGAARRVGMWWTSVLGTSVLAAAFSWALA